MGFSIFMFLARSISLKGIARLVVGIAIFTILSYVLLIGTPIVYVIIPALFELEISPWAFFTDDSAYELHRAEFERICEERTETLLAKIFNN